MTLNGNGPTRRFDAIILRTLRKAPSERYASVGDLEKDIRHYLVGEPVHARPNTVPYRLLRFAGRHKRSSAPFAIGAIVILALLALNFLLVQRQARPPLATPLAIG
jgi:serine/threonine-protein kinase